MKSVYTILSAAAVMVGMSSCAETAKKSALDLGGDWKVVKINETELPDSLFREPALTINMDSMAFYGVTGVNLYNGDLKVDGDSVSFSDGPMTRVMGDSISMVVEQNFVSALAAVKSASVNDSVLVLKDAENNAVMTLKKK
ncbi:MAG: META domain-containing protein [Bacteroidia bacterium]|nr:META domain-containing protein [Bacteroidia bacterium]